MNGEISRLEAQLQEVDNLVDIIGKKSSIKNIKPENYAKVAAELNEIMKNPEISAE